MGVTNSYIGYKGKTDTREHYPLNIYENTAYFNRDRYIFIV